jgi:hypothetical protein
MEVGSRKFIVGCCSVRGERGVRTVVIVYSVCICAEDNLVYLSLLMVVL